MRRVSVAHRLERLVDRGHAGNRERLIHDAAVETGLHPTEVRAELESIEEHTRRFGPSTLEQTVRRCAEELGLSEDDLWSEVAGITDGGGKRP